MERKDAIYVRQSIEKKDSVSLETQVELCRRLADPDAEVYRDAGYSGKNTNRPEFGRLMDDIRQGTIKRVLCYRLDRISRSIVDFGLIWRTLEQYGTEFCSVTEQFDTGTPMGRAMVNIIIVFAQLERETIAERIKTNYYARTAAGAWGGGRAPFGFRNSRAEINGKRCAVLEPDSTEVEAVRKMFDLYETGSCSLGQIAAEMNRNGTPPGTKRNLWTNVNVRKVLNNPVYVQADVELYAYFLSCGLAINADITDFDGSHAAVIVGSRDSSTRKRRSFSERSLSITYHKGFISSAQYITVQKNLKQNKQIKNKAPSAVSWANGLLKCASCGYSMSIYSDQHGRRYCKCNGRYTMHICDQRTSIRPDDLEAALERRMQEYMDSSESGNSRKANSPELVKLKLELTEIEQRISNIVEAVAVGGGIAMKRFSEELGRLEARQEAIGKKIADAEPSRSASAIEYVENVHALPFESKRTLSRKIIKEVKISENTFVIETI